MKPIKQKPPFGNQPKILARTIRIPHRLAKVAAERSRHTAEATPEDKEHTSSTAYAIDKAGEIAGDTASAITKPIQDAFRDRRIKVKLEQQAPTDPQVDDDPSGKAPRTGEAHPRPARSGQASSADAKQAHIRNAQAGQTQQVRGIQCTNSQAGLAPAQQHSVTQRMKEPARVAKLPKQVSKGAIKTAKAGRTAIKTGNVGIKTAQTTVSAAKGSLQAGKRAARSAVQAARIAGKAAVAAAKIAARVSAMLAKMAVAAAKALMMAIASGGWVVIIILIAAAAISAILTSAFGIFFSNDAGAGMPMTQAIVEINTDFTDALQRKIDELSAGGSYDAVVVSYDDDFDGDSVMVNNWQDVLGVYAVKTVSDETAGTEVITLNPEKIEVLKKVFLAMNEAIFTTREETDTGTDENGDPVTVTTLYIDIRIESKTYLEGAAYYHFSREKLDMLEELMSPLYYELFAALLSVEMFGGLTSADLTGIVSNLPAGTKGADIVQAALNMVGTPYSKMDCSELSRHAYANVGVSLPRTSVEQAKYCYNNGYMIGAGQLQPGDLVFWSKTSCTCGRWNEIHHVGVVVGNGMIVDASSAKGRVVLRNLWSESNWTIWGYGRAHV